MTHTDWPALRAQMVRRQLASRGIRSPEVLAALGRVPRERFVPDASRSHACSDHAMAIGHGQTISQPYMVAVMTEALELKPTDRVLEVGTGSGYQCAVLAELAGEVWSVERIAELAKSAALLLAELGYATVHVRTGDGSLGWPESAPFDAVIVTAAAPRAPDPLLEQLSPEGGRLVVPVGDRDLQQLTLIRRDGDAFETRRSVGCRFVPLLGRAGWES